MVDDARLINAHYNNNGDMTRDVIQPAKIRIRRMRISCAKSVGCKCGFVARSNLTPAIIATAIQLSLSYLKLNSYKQTSSE